MRSAVLGGALLSTAVLHATARHDAQLPLDPASFMLDHGADDDYSIFTHPSMQEHRLRFKRTDGWCKGADTKSYAGYIDHDDSSLFFYYYESRNKPAEDPVVLWINGGPWAAFLGQVLTSAESPLYAEAARPAWGMCRPAEYQASSD